MSAPPFRPGKALMRTVYDGQGFAWVVRLSELGIEVRAPRKRRWRFRGWPALIESCYPPPPRRKRRRPKRRGGARKTDKRPRAAPFAKWDLEHGHGPGGGDRGV